MRIALLCAALAAAAGLHAETLILWPSDLCEVVKHGASEFTLDDQHRIRVTTGTGYAWPGVTVAFKSGAYDLAAYGPLRVIVRSAAAKPITVSLSVKNRPQKGHSPGGSVMLKPDEEGVIATSLRVSPWMLDKLLELVGMRGFPSHPRSPKGSASAPSISGRSAPPTIRGASAISWTTKFRGATTTARSPSPPRSRPPRSPRNKPSAPGSKKSTRHPAR